MPTLPEIRTERLHLRALTVDDGSALMDLHADPRVSNWAGQFDRSAARARLEKFADQWRDLGYGMFSVEDGGGRFIGRCGFVYRPEMGTDGETAIGWVFNPRYWGQGFATEAAAACLAWIGSSGPAGQALTFVTAIIAPGNAASEAVAGRLGMVLKRLDTFRGHPVQIFVTTPGSRPI